MTDTAPDADRQQFILIPGQSTFRKSVVPPLSVRLPITAYVDRQKTILVGIVWTFVVLSMALAASACFLHSSQIHPTWFQNIALTLLGLFTIGMIPLSSAAAFFSFQDANSHDPVLIVDKQGLTDNRSGVSIKWKDVASARPIPNWGVTLQMRDPSLLPKSLRLGYPLMIRRKSGEVHVQSKFLSISEHEIINSVLELAGTGGGEVLPARVFRFL